MPSPSTPPVRLSDLVASLSLATDLGLGLPQEHVLRQTVIAARVADAADLPPDVRAATFFVSLLAWVGCIADSHELAHWFDDDRQIRADSYQVDRAGVPMLRFMLDHVASGQPPLQRLTMIGRFLTTGMRTAQASYLTHCQTTGDIARRLGIGDEVGPALAQAFERWDGRGIPGALRRTQIDPAMRVVQLANDAEVYHRVGGVRAATAMARDRSAAAFDPDLVEVCCHNADAIFGDLESVDTWATSVEGCRSLDRVLSEDDLTSVLEVFADYADQKSPYFLGHSRATADLACAAAQEMGLAEDDVTTLRRAALVCRLGRTGVSTGIWDKCGPLSTIEWERVRTTPYLTERVLSREPRLRRIGTLAAMVSERMDGSGYPRGLSGSAIPVAARLLAAADVYRAAGAERPHRTALTRSETEALLRDEVAAGRLGADAVRAVLASAGHVVGRRTSAVAGLTARELEVLALLVRGLSNRQIADRLTISPRTAGTHVEHIYTKIGVSTRGAAAMFAMEHGLERSGE